MLLGFDSEDLLMLMMMMRLWLLLLLSLMNMVSCEIVVAGCLRVAIAVAGAEPVYL